MNNEKLKIIEKYLPNGVIKGGEILLTPEIMISFIDDLSELPVKITGCDLWRFVDPDKKPDWIVQLLGAGLIIEENVFDPRKNSKEGIAEILKEYIKKDFPSDAQLVSLIFGEDEMYDLVRSIGKNGIPPMI